MKSRVLLRYCVSLLCCVVSLPGCKFLNLNTDEAPGDQTCVADQNTVRQQKFGLDSETEARVSATLLGTVALTETAKKLDDQIADLCAGISRELGAKSPAVEGSAELGNRSQAACNTAIETIQAAKQKAEANMTVEMKEPACGSLLDDFSSCVRECDPNVASMPAGGISCETDKLTGRCGDKCSGTCTEGYTDSCKSTCQGKCQGKCTQGFFGKCGGKCIGTCDMANVNGKCDGNCDGKCLSEANGTCEGKCEGKCQGACVTELKKRECGGICTGSCSDKMTSARCNDIVLPPELNPECSAMCSARTAGKLSCSGGFVEVLVFSAKNKSSAESIRSAVGGRLKEILTVGDGMAQPLEKASARVKEALDGLEQTANDSPEIGAKISTCLKDARSKQESAAAAFVKLHELGQALFQATRN